MPVFCVTFGQRFRREPHPADVQIHPDGWVEIEARSEEAATAVARKHFGDQWSNLYSETDFDRQYFPLGCLFRLTE